jgi:hypothetical protein
MFRFLGSREKAKDGCTRRTVLQASGLAALGFMLPRFLKTAPKVSNYVNIVAPGPGNVSGGGSFIAYGYTDQPGKATAFVSDDDLEWHGTAATPPPQSPPYNWAFSFSGIPMNQFLCLSVQAGSAMQVIAMQVIGIRCVN